MVNKRFENLPRVRIQVDSNDIWSDVTAVYKNYDDYNTKLRIQLDNQPALDTGGVRRQMYTTVFRNFANNLTV